MENDKLKKVNEGILELKNTIKTKDREIEKLRLDLELAGELIVQANKNTDRDPQFKESIQKMIAVADDLAKRDLEYPDQIAVSNLKEVAEKIQELIDSKEEFPKEMRISNLGEIKGEKEVKVSNLGDIGKLFTTGLTGAVKAIRELGSKAFNAVVTGEVRITNKEIQDAIPVRLASKDLRFFYDAMTTVMGSGGSSTDIGLLQQIIDAIEALGGTWYDTITVTYPVDTTEVYTYSLAAVTVQTITVVYTDNTKVDLLSVTKT
jgi:hypothetical protein